MGKADLLIEQVSGCETRGTAKESCRQTSTGRWGSGENFSTLKSVQKVLKYWAKNIFFKCSICEKSNLIIHIVGTSETICIHL